MTIFLLVTGFILIAVLIENKSRAMNRNFQVSSQIMERIYDDIYDIKKHLGLEVEVRTQEKQKQEVRAYIREQIEKGRTKEEIIADLKRANESLFMSDEFGTSSVGPLCIDYYAVVIGAMISENKRTLKNEH